jgi:hypothetical protein
MMLRLTVELVPGGSERRRRTIATMRISNASDLADLSDYRIEAMEGANHQIRTSARSGACVVRQHDRRQSVWKLIEAACRALEDAEFVEF